MKQNFNLSRKYRPQRFSDLVGQEIIARMLQNSLFLGKLFPAYLFSGQRGCGKTSTARIFAKALCCDSLSAFCKTPTNNPVPCLVCTSCKMMETGQHPDLVEVDAASHTGVDNVRGLIEGASYQPVMGKKKIYIIDEVHMLSKSAFNALLKTLEEPPSSAVFILATTEIGKIPETIRSRCFLCIFPRITTTPLISLLEKIAISENIAFEAKALPVIANGSDGCARDAINLFEQVSIYEKKVSLSSTLAALQIIPPTEIIELLQKVTKGDPATVLEVMINTNFAQFSPHSIFDLLVTTSTKLLKKKLKIKEPLDVLDQEEEMLKDLAEKTDLKTINQLIQLLWKAEPAFLKTRNKQLFLQNTLLQMTETTKPQAQATLSSRSKNTEAATKESTTKAIVTTQKPIQPDSTATAKPTPEKAVNPEKTGPSLKPTELPQQWHTFLKEIKNVSNDQILISILAGVNDLNCDKTSKILTIYIPRTNRMILEKVSESKEIWLSPLQKQFPETTNLELKSTNQPAEKFRKKTPEAVFLQPKSQLTPKTTKHDFSNKEKWPKVNLLLQHFPGKIIVEN